MNVSQDQPSHAFSIRIPFWLPIFVVSCATPASNVNSSPALLEARLLDESPAIIKGASQERTIESQTKSTATLTVVSAQEFTVTYTPNPSEDQAVALNHGVVPNQNWWNYETDTMTAVLSAGQVTWVKNPNNNLRPLSGGNETTYKVTGFAGTGQVNVQVFKSTSPTPIINEMVTPAAASSGTIQGVRMVHYTDNTGRIEITSNSEEIELEVGGFPFP
jgi:hypothetical protein